jgi:hypothetical protein
VSSEAGRSWSADQWRRMALDEPPPTDAPTNHTLSAVVVGDQLRREDIRVLTLTLQAAAGALTVTDALRQLPATLVALTPAEESELQGYDCPPLVRKDHALPPRQAAQAALRGPQWLLERMRAAGALDEELQQEGSLSDGGSTTAVEGWRAEEALQTSGTKAEAEDAAVRAAEAAEEREVAEGVADAVAEEMGLEEATKVETVAEEAALGVLEKGGSVEQALAEAGEAAKAEVEEEEEVAEGVADAVAEEMGLEEETKVVEAAEEAALEVLEKGGSVEQALAEAGEAAKAEEEEEEEAAEKVADVVAEEMGLEEDTKVVEAAELAALEVLEKGGSQAQARDAAEEAAAAEEHTEEATAQKIGDFVARTAGEVIGSEVEEVAEASALTVLEHGGSEAEAQNAAVRSATEVEAAALTKLEQEAQGAATTSAAEAKETALEAAPRTEARSNERQESEVLKKHGWVKVEAEAEAAAAAALARGASEAEVDDAAKVAAEDELLKEKGLGQVGA